MLPEASLEMETLVERALRKRPEDRFQTAEEFLAALDETPEAQSGSTSDLRRTREAIAYANTESFEQERVEPSRSGLAQTTGQRTGTGSRSIPAHHAPRSGGGMRLLMWTFSLCALAAAAAWIGPEIVMGPSTASSTGAAPTTSVQASQREAQTALPQRTEGPSISPAQAVEPSVPPALVADAGATLSVTEVPEGEPQAATSPGVSPEPGLGDDPTMRFRLDDGGLVVDDLSEQLLAEADEALNDPAETEAPPETEAEKAAPPRTLTLAGAKALIAKGRTDEAISVLRRLRRKDPKNPTLPVLLGDLYFEKDWWSDGLGKYREAIRLRKSVARNATLQKNAIKALAGDKTYARARALLVRDIGRAGRENLRRAAKRDPSPVVRKRASRVLRHL
jgi:tetratricopeptide (TPR) repeat protein